MLEFQLECVQEHTLQALLRQRAVEIEVAVLVVAGDGKAEMSKMHADLMRASGKQLRREQRAVAEGPLAPEHRLRFAAFAIHAHPPLPGLREIFLERQVHAT